MSNLEFSINLKGNIQKIIDISADYERYPLLLENHIKSVKIIEKTSDQTVTEEILRFSTYIKQDIIQQAIHKTIGTNQLHTEIISGPFRGSKLQALFEQIDSGTKVSVSADLKLSLKYKILGPIIKKVYKMVLTGLLYTVDGLAILTEGRSWQNSMSDDAIIITKDLPKPLIFHSWHKGDLISCFVNKQYKNLPINGNVIVDVGANIGDSGIYFASAGAKQVISVEPFPKNCEIAKLNICANNLADKITLIQASCSNVDGEILVDPQADGTSSRTKKLQNGIKIPTITIETLVNSYNLNSALLKMDCEGCEYETILSTQIPILQKFTHIIIEYHDGYESLKNKLEEAGFAVNIEHVDEKMKEGYLYATLNKTT